MCFSKFESSFYIQFFWIWILQLFKVIFTECLFPYHIYIYNSLGEMVCMFFSQHTQQKKSKQPGKSSEEAWGNPWKWWCFECFFQPAKPPTNPLRGAPKKTGGFGLPIPALQQRQALAAAKAAGEAGGFSRVFGSQHCRGGNIFVGFFVGGRGIEVFLVGLWLDVWLFEFVLRGKEIVQHVFWFLVELNSWKTSGLEFCFKNIRH